MSAVNQHHFRMTALTCLPVIALLMLALAAVTARGEPPIGGIVPTTLRKQGLGRQSTAGCTERFLTQYLDHFSFAQDTATYQQRYFVCQDNWVPASGTVLFYCGNEADVSLYVNATGLMWENAKKFGGSMLVFAEHRFYGKSIPNVSVAADGHPYLSSELALADYATLIAALRAEFEAAGIKRRVPFVAFGGSYGGKLAAWLRIKYPAAVAGAISASAPLLGFRGENPMWDSGSYYRVVSRTAGLYGSCAANIHAVFPVLEAHGSIPAFRSQLQDWLGLCSPLHTEYDVSMLRFWVRDAFDSLAMGNYPFATSYIGGSYNRPLPPYPARVACSHLSESTLAQAPEKLFPALRRAVAVLYNATGDGKCFDLPAYPTSLDPAKPMDGIWDWQWCTEAMPDSYWFSTDGKSDMFWPNPYNQTLIDTHCEAAWHVRSRPEWVAAEYGGRGILRGASNIVFSSGSFDGWSSAGIATNDTAKSVHSFLIEGGGHHLDLFWSNPADPASVVAVRSFELAQVAKWVQDDVAQPQAQAWGDNLQ